MARGNAKPQAGKVALITGASRGIGKAISAHLALKGYRIAVTARSVQDRDVTPFPGTIMETAALVKSLGGEALPIRCDVENAEDIQAAVHKTIEHWGRIDVMINNARYEGPAHWGMLAEVDAKEIDKLINCNFRGPLLLCRLVVPQMIKQGGGLIINTTSSSARFENPNLPGHGSTSLLYPASKAGLDRMAVGLTKEVRQHNIAVIGMSPGATLTERATVVTSTYGYDLSRRHSVHVPAAFVGYLVSHPDPMVFTGKIFEAPDFVREHCLLTPQELATPFRPGELYDPYSEPYWRRITAE